MFSFKLDHGNVRVGHLNGRMVRRVEGETVRLKNVDNCIENGLNIIGRCGRGGVWK